MKKPTFPTNPAMLLPCREISIGWTDGRRLGKGQYEYNFEFDEEPVIGEDSCSAGKLSDSTLREALNLINLIRKTAGLGEVELDDELNNYAQYGALIMAASGDFSHYPGKADNVTKDQFSLFEEHKI